MTSATAVARIPFDELPAPLRELLAPRVRRLGYLGHFFQLAAHQPEALASFVQLTERLKTALPDRLVEVIALAVATRADNAYERVQHERLALTGILTVEEVRALVSEQDLSAIASFSPAEREAAGLARVVVDTHGRDAGPAFARLSDLVGEAVSVGCLMMAARYVAHAAMANCWCLEPPRPSPLEEPA